MRRRWWVAIALVSAAIVAIPVAFVVSNAVGAVTFENGRTIFWRDYPGVAGLDPQDVIDGPTAEQALLDGEAMVADMREAITEEFGLAWVGDPNEERFEPFFPTENRFGGRSMLTTINAPTSQSTTVPTSWTDKQRVIQLIGEVAAGHGFGKVVLDHERDYVTEEDRARDFGGSSPATQVFVSGIVEGPDGQWVFFGLQDPSLDVDGRFEDRLSGGDWEPASVTLSYGANALLPAASHTEFQRRLLAFQGLTQPNPLED